MPLPDNFASLAFDRAWGRDKIMPRELNADENHTLAVIASAIQALRTCVRTIQALPITKHELTWGPCDVIGALVDQIYSLKEAAKDIERIPQDEADEANDRAAEEA